MNLSDRKKAFLTGTLLLTGTGFICRILGFFYRIFLSRTIGAEGLGIYNMIHPVFGICFSVCAGSMQTALSQYIAGNMRKGKTIFRIGVSLSLMFSLALAAVICLCADFIAASILLEPACSPLLPLLALSVPFAALHACINGYYYGMQKNKVPAFSQVAEQVVRMVFVFAAADYWIRSGKTITVELAVVGHLIGEAASAGYTLISYLLFPPHGNKNGSSPKKAGKIWQSLDTPLLFAGLMAIALPLMGNRLVINFLTSAEAVLIPSRLVKYGLSSSDAFSVYGVLTGMAIPFILFPSAITNSLAVLLLPAVAKAQAEGNQERIAATISMSLRYSLYMGILCTGIFCLFGMDLGTSVFHNPSAGMYISILGWLCPFLYLATTMGSILNGLGKTSTTFKQSACALCLRLVFVLMGIPVLGIKAYLWGVLVSEIFLGGWHLITLQKKIPVDWDLGDMVVKPVILLGICLAVNHAFTLASDSLYRKCSMLPGGTYSFLGTAIKILIFSLTYGGLLLFSHRLKKGDRS